MDALFAKLNRFDLKLLLRFFAVLTELKIVTTVNYFDYTKNWVKLKFNYEKINSTITIYFIL